MIANFNSRIIRRLVSAEGYMELGMPVQAIQELESIEDAGVLEAPRQFLIGRALVAQGLYSDAVAPLEFAARQMPSPVKKIAWRALSECYRECGSDQLADVAEQIAGPPMVEQVSLQFPGLDMSVALDAVR